MVILLLSIISYAIFLFYRLYCFRWTMWRGYLLLKVTLCSYFHSQVELNWLYISKDWLSK
jgi:hypothetical protein